jgi:hypothetical protein
LLSCFNNPPYKGEDVVHALLLLISCHWHSIIIWFQQWVEVAPTDLTKTDCVGHKNYMIGSKRLLINLVVLIVRSWLISVHSLMIFNPPLINTVNLFFWKIFSDQNYIEAHPANKALTKLISYQYTAIPVMFLLFIEVCKMSCYLCDHSCLYL